MHYSPKQLVAKAFGGGIYVAINLGIDKASFSRWRRIPSRHMASLLEMSENRGLGLKPRDLICGRIMTAEQFDKFGKHNQFTRKKKKK